MRGDVGVQDTWMDVYPANFTAGTLMHYAMPIAVNPAFYKRILPCGL